MELLLNKLHNEDALLTMKKMADNSIDCIATDPPYGYSFMGKDWDKVVPSVKIWSECLRVLKPGAFAFIMSAPRQDVLSHMIINLDKAGFDTSFTSIYWTYASGFPKAMNIGKKVDAMGGKYLGWFIDYVIDVAKEKGITPKQLTDLFPSKNGNATGWLWNKRHTQGITIEQYNKIKNFLKLPFENIQEAERKIIGTKKAGLGSGNTYAFTENNEGNNQVNITTPSSEEAKKLDGSYGGFQPKPAVEIIIVVMKPLAEKSLTEQALKNGKGITWLDDCRVPFGKEPDSGSMFYHKRDAEYSLKHSEGFVENEANVGMNTEGRFPANLLVSDDILNDGKVYAGQQGEVTGDEESKFERGNTHGDYSGIGNPMKPRNDAGSFSRYYDLDKWWEERIKSLPENMRKVFPFLITPKAAKSEKNFGVNGEGKFMDESREVGSAGGTNPRNRGAETKRKNHHPTVKPIKLMSYLVTLGSREQDTIYDPFSGSGTTLIAARMIARNFIGSEIEKEYFDIAQQRLLPFTSQTVLF